MSLAVKVRCLHHTFNMPLFFKTDFLIVYVEGVNKRTQNLQKKTPYIAYFKRKRT